MPRTRGRCGSEGALNLVWLLGVVAVVFLIGSVRRAVPGRRPCAAGVRSPVMLGFAALSFKTTKPRIHELNRFNWAPIVEVAVVFVGVFVTMVPAMSLRAERGSTLGITEPWQFFWASGALSSVLDNAPTYLTFASLAAGVAGGGAGALSPDNLGALAAHPVGPAAARSRVVRRRLHGRQSPTWATARTSWSGPSPSSTTCACPASSATRSGRWPS